MQALALDPQGIDVVIVEVKTNQPCTLNGPWTRQELLNVHRVLAAIGCVPPDDLSLAAADIYREGIHRANPNLRIRLVAVGRDRNEELSGQFPAVTQLTWIDMLRFVWRRFHAYRRQKTQVDQWDDQGLRLKQLADEAHDEGSFVTKALALLGIRNRHD